MSAIDQYKLMLRTQFGPALRAHGFKGSGRSYSLPNESHWINVGFQGWRTNTPVEATFTINYAVIRRDVWTDRWEAFCRSWGEEIPKVEANKGGSRIGHLLPIRTDKWWTIDSHSDLSSVAADVIDAIDNYLMPEIRKLVADNVKTTGSFTADYEYFLRQRSFRERRDAGVLGDDGEWLP